MKPCFGTIYPDVEKFRFGKPMSGRVFRIIVNTVGPGHRDRELNIDENAWEDCRRCEDFRNCLDFSNAKLQMKQVVMSL